MKVSPWVVPVLVVLLTAAGVGVARLFAIPTLTMDLSQPTPSRDLETLTLTVDGVRCADTARRAASTLEGEPGVVRCVAFASHSLLEITYDPAVTDRATVVGAIEGPVFDESTGEFRFGVFDVLEK